MRPLVFWLVLAGLTLSGCASITPVVTREEATDPKSGYVAGLFTRMKTRGFAFVIKEVNGSREFVMSLGEDSSVPTEVKNQTVAIRLPPGKYVVSQWITYATITKEVMSRSPVTNPVLSRSFEVDAGNVIHLGSYDVSATMVTGSPRAMTYLRIRPRSFTQSEAKKALAEAYPNLASQPFRCLLCSDTIGLPTSR